MPKQKILVVTDDDKRRTLLASILEAAGFSVMFGHESAEAGTLAASVLVEANKGAAAEYKRLLEKLSVLGEMLGTAHDPSAIFSAILDFVVQSVPCSTLLISLYDEKDDTRRSIYLWYGGSEIDVTGMQPFPAGSGFSKQAIKSCAVMI